MDRSVHGNYQFYSLAPIVGEGRCEEIGERRVGARGLVRLKACLIEEVEVLFRYTLSGL